MRADTPAKVVPSTVEPRLVERRRAVRAAEQRRRRRTLAALAAVAAVVLAAIGALLSPLLDVDRVEVSGAERLTADRVVEVSGIELRVPMVAADLSQARAALISDPWIAAAHLTRRWPGTILVEVVEHRPAAVVAHPGGALTASSAGTVLEAGSAVEELPRIVSEAATSAGPGDALPDELRRVLSLVEQVDPAVSPAIGAHRLLRGGALEWSLVDGGTVRFGRLEDLPAKLLAAETVLGQVVLECLDVVDVREPTRVTVRRRSGCEAPPPTERAIHDEATGPPPGQDREVP